MKDIKEFPFPLIGDKEQSEIASQIESFVRNILDVKKADPKASTREMASQIDTLVYKLYGLNEEEVKVIEGK